MTRPTWAGGETLAVLALPLTALLFSTNVLMARWAVGDLQPVAMAFGRWLLFVLLVLPSVRGELWRQRAALWRERWQMLLMGTTGIAMCAVFPYIAGHTTTATNIALIYTLAPALIIVGSALWLRERMRPWQWLGVTLAFLGVLAIVLKGTLATLLALAFVPGDIWIVVASFAWAVYCLLLKFWPSALSGGARLAGCALAALLVMLPFLVWEVAAVAPPPLTWKSLAIILFLAAVPSYICYQLLGWTTRVVGAARSALTGYMMPAFAALIAWAGLGERLYPYHLIGGALVLFGVWLANRRRPG